MYTIGMTTNNGSTYMAMSSKYTSKREAAKSARAICKGNTFAGNTGHWSVYDDAGDTVLEGTVR